MTSPTDHGGRSRATKSRRAEAAGTTHENDPHQKGAKGAGHQVIPCGGAKGAEDVAMTAVGTPLYVAPEIARGELYDESADVYSFGLTLADMATEQNILEFIGER